MRLTNINIENYGPHTGWNPGNGGIAAGLNVIHGPNEAGKSAIRAFIRMVLFGRPRRPRVDSHEPRPFNYSHVGVENGSGSISIKTSDEHDYVFYRVEGKKPEVSGNQSGNEDLLRSLIGRIDDALYQNIFSISLSELQFDPTLGDKSIHDRIYSAGLGLGNVSLPAALKELEDERSASKGLWSPGAGRLRANLKNKKALEQNLLQKAAELAGYELVTADIANLQSQITDLEEGLQTARGKELRYKSVNDLRAATGRKATIEAGLAEFADGRPFPSDGIARLDRLRASLDSVRDQINTGNIQAAESESKLAHLGVMEPFIEAESQITRLLSSLDLYTNAVVDIPRVLMETDAASTEISAGLIAIDASWSEALLDEFTDSAGARRKVKQVGGRLDEASTALVRGNDAAEHAEKAFRDARDGETRVRRRISQIENPPSETSDELRDRQDTLERLRAAVAERTARQGIDQRIRQAQPRRGHWLLNAVRSMWNALRRLIGLDPAESENAADNATGPESFTDLDDEINALATALNLGSEPAERALVEQISRLGRAVEKRVALDREQSALAEIEAVVAGAENESTRNSSELTEAEQASRVIEAEWKQLLKELHLSASLDQSGAQATLGDLGELRVKLLQVRKDQIRIDRMNAAIREVEESLTPVVAAVGMQKFQHMQAGQALTELADKFRSHQDALASGETLRLTIDSWTKKRSVLVEESGRVRSEIDSLLEAAGCNSDQEEDFRALGEASDQRIALELELRQLNEANPRLAQSDDSGLAAEIEATTPEDIEAARQTVAEEITKLESDRDALRETLWGLNKRRQDAEQSDPTSEIQREIDRLEQIVQEDAHRWAVLTVAKQILDAARTEYQSERQAPLMRKASEHFRRMTGGAYEKVETIVGEEEIQVVRSTGRVKPVTELSRGTAEQLYLAMRFAFIDEYTEHTEPVPVLMDDVLVNFDEARSRAASEAIVEFSRKHQVLLLTCHEQTVEGMKDAAKAARVGGPEIIRL